MSKLTRIVGRVFGSQAGPSQIGVFGSLFAGTGVTTTDPATAQSLSNWLTGWDGAAIGGNSPAIEDMNSAFFVLAYQIAYILQAGVPEWNTETVYYIGSLVNDATGVVYRSITDNNQGNALTDTTKWRNTGNGNFQVNAKSANYVSTPNDGFIPCNAGTGAFQVTLPAAASAVGKQMIFVKADSTSNAVTLVAAGADTINGAANYLMTAQFEAMTLISDGVSNWYSL